MAFQITLWTSPFKFSNLCLVRKCEGETFLGSLDSGPVLACAEQVAFLLVLTLPTTSASAFNLVSAVIQFPAVEQHVLESQASTDHESSHHAFHTRIGSSPFQTFPMKE